MSGIEPFIMSALAAAGEAATAVGSTIASTASSAGAAITGSAATAGEFAAIAGGTEAALSGAAATGLTTGEVIAGASALSSAAGAGASLLAKPPKINAPTMPTRDNARAEADQRSLALKRRGRAATLLTGSEGVTSAPTLGSPSLTGTA
jgi:hypothetical protein